MQKRNGAWLVDSPTELIGWEVLNVMGQEGNGRVSVSIQNKATKEVRTVSARVEAVPLQTVERRKSR